MEILDKKLQFKIRFASKKLGVSEHEILNRAVSTYIGSFEDLLNLNNELRVWDILSAKSMRKYNF